MLWVEAATGGAGEVMATERADDLSQGGVDHSRDDPYADPGRSGPKERSFGLDPMAFSGSVAAERSGHAEDLHGARAVE